MNEKFFELSKEKQDAIINGALKVFSKYEYKKATTEEIANLAGVSKSLLFHYFKNKKGLYLYVYDYSLSKAFEQVNMLNENRDNDFFNIIINAQNAKVEILKDHPDLMLFLTKAYFEKDKEIKSVISDSFKDITALTKMNFFKDVDLSKFKDDVEPKKVLNIVFWMAEGFMKGRSKSEFNDLIKLNQEFLEHIELLKKHFYKEEYL